MSVIGIDLGTVNSSVAACDGGQITVLGNEQAKRTTPSVVAFVDHGRLIGQRALEQISRNPADTIYGMKKIIGRQYDDPEVRRTAQRNPHKMLDSKGNPVFEVSFKDFPKLFSPEELTAMILSHLAEIAEKHFDEKVRGAVITVPATFTAAQRKATLQAAKIARLPLLGLINEPIAAAISFDMVRKAKGKRTLLVFQLGGGFFSASILTIEGGIFDVKSTTGSSRIGGQEFTYRLFQHFAKEILAKCNVEIMTSPKAAAALHVACEKAKKEFSLRPGSSAKIQIPLGKQDFESSISYEKFIELSADLFQNMELSIRQALIDARVVYTKIDDVILVGGSTRIPMIEQLLTKHLLFDAKKIRKIINLDEAAVTGAAVRAASLSQDKSEYDLSINGILANSLSIGSTEDSSVIVSRSSSLPVYFSRQVSIRQNQTLTVFEAELIPPCNNEAGYMWTENTRPVGIYRHTHVSRSGGLHINFKIDDNGLLYLKADDGVRLVEENGLKKEDVARMIAEADKYRLEDKERNDAMQELNGLERDMYDLQGDLESGKYKTTPSIKRKACGTCCALLDQIQETMNPSQAEVQRIRGELENLLRSLQYSRR